jgi:hypothetical protein
MRNSRPCPLSRWMFRDVGNPELVRCEPMEFTVDEVISGRDTVEPFDLRRVRQSNDFCLRHEDSKEPFTDFHAHPESQLCVHSARPVSVSGGNVRLAN